MKLYKKSAVTGGVVGALAGVLTGVLRDYTNLNLVETIVVVVIICVIVGGAINIIWK